MFKRFSSLKKLFSNDNKVEHEDLKLHSLSPINNIEEVDAKYKTYNDILYFALNEKSIHNIAITGQYGSGKSTVIDSYFKDKPHKDFFKISLATFSVSNNEKTETNIKLIEKGILQQMFYRKAADAFPFSRFKRIKAYHPFYIVLLEICLLCSICFLSIVLKPEWLKTIHDLIKETYYYITFIIATLGFFIIVFFVMKFFLKFRLTKFTFQKIEFGLDDVKDESLLNKYVDEILYFFE